MTVEGSELYVDGMFVTNKLGTERSRELFLREGVAFVITPSQKKFEITLNNYGQRQALLFEATRTFGVKRFAFSRKSFTQGKVCPFSTSRTPFWRCCAAPPCWRTAARFTPL